MTIIDAVQHTFDRGDWVISTEVRTAEHPEIHCF